MGYPSAHLSVPDHHAFSDIAAVTPGYGFEAVRTPTLIDAKVTCDHGAWWLEGAFRGH